MISDFFTQAELSLAAYATLNIGVPNTTSLEEAGKQQGTDHDSPRNRSD